MSNRLLSFLMLILCLNVCISVADNMNEKILIGESSRDYVSNKIGLVKWYEDTIYDKFCILNNDDFFEFKFYKESDFNVLLSIRKQINNNDFRYECIEIEGDLSIDDTLNASGPFYLLAEKLSNLNFEKIVLNDYVLFKKILRIEYTDLPETFKKELKDSSLYTYHKLVKYYVRLSKNKIVGSIEKEVSYYDNPI